MDMNDATTVVGVFDDLATATDAVDALEADGIDPAGEVSLLGPEHEMRPELDRIGASRGQAQSGLFAAVAEGATSGTVVGAGVIAFGAVASTMMPGVGLDPATATAIGAASGAAGGGVVGGLFGAEGSGRASAAWQQSLSPLLRRVDADGVTLVAAHVDADRVTTAAEVLEPRATEVHTFNTAR